MTRHRFRPGAAALALGIAALFAAVPGCGKPPPDLPPPDTQPVKADHPAMTSYAPVKEFTGRLATKDPVKVQPQVSGALLRRRFEEGQPVEPRVVVLGFVLRPGTVLYEIDPVLYVADVKKAEADLEKANADIKNWEAQIRLADAELARVNQAMASGAASKTDLDKAKATKDVNAANLDLARASRDAAEAALIKARQNLDYCTIYAPAEGTVGLSQAADSSLVEAFKTVLTEVYPVDPVYAYWEVDELTSLWYRAQIEAGAIDNPRDPATPLSCTITLKNGKSYTSTMDYIDPEIVRGTGTRTVRAKFPNPPVATAVGPDGRPNTLRMLSAGDSVRVKVTSGRPRQVLTVPEGVAFPQQGKRYVYVVNGESKAELREVELGPTFDGRQVVEKGLTTADRVIVNNLLRVRPGSKVEAK